MNTPTPIGPSDPPAASIASSPIADLTYRGYDGPLNPPLFRWWTVCKMSLGLIWRKPWFWIIAAIPILPYFMHALFFYIALFRVNAQIAGNEMLQAQMPEISEVVTNQYAFQMYSAFTAYLNGLVILTISLIVAAGNASIAADNHANALLIYLSKPIRKGDYLLGKWMTYFLSILVVTAIPALCFYLFIMATYTPDGFWRDAPWLWLQTLAVIALPAVFHSSILLGISAWTRSPRMVAAVYAGMNFVTWILALASSRTLFPANSWQRALAEKASFQGIIDGLAQNILHARELTGLGKKGLAAGKLPHFAALPPVMPLLIVGLILVVAGIVAARMKVQAVEVVRG